MAWDAPSWREAAADYHEAPASHPLIVETEPARKLVTDHNQKSEASAAPVDPPWPTMDGAAYHGLAGDVVRTIAPHTEADPVAILIQFLALAGNAMGRTAYYLVEDDRHHTNLFAVLVGESSKARKGTSLGRVRAIIEGRRRGVERRQTEGRAVLRRGPDQ